jgi:hypothetical protein
VKRSRDFVLTIRVLLAVRNRGGQSWSELATARRCPPLAPQVHRTLVKATEGQEDQSSVMAILDGRASTAPTLVEVMAPFLLLWSMQTASARGSPCRRNASRGRTQPHVTLQMPRAPPRLGF